MQSQLLGLMKDRGSCDCDVLWLGRATTTTGVEAQHAVVKSAELAEVAALEALQTAREELERARIAGLAKALAERLQGGG